MLAWEYVTKGPTWPWQSKIESRGGIGRFMAQNGMKWYTRDISLTRGRLNTFSPKQNGRGFANDILNAFSPVEIVVFWLWFHWILLLTHWGRVTHIRVSKHTIIGSDNGLSPGRRQPIIWTNAGTLLIGTLGTNFSEILIEIRIFSSKKMGLKVSSVKWRPFCLGLNVLRV